MSAIAERTGDDLTADERRILRERADAIARVSETSRVEGRPAIFFRLGRQRCCSFASSTRAAVRLVGLTPIPGAPRTVAGALARGGEIIPVFHLASVLGDRLDRLPETAHALVLGSQTDDVAVAVDLLDGFGEIADGTLRPPPEEAHSPFITAATADGALFVDLDALLASGALWVDAAQVGGSRDE